MNTLVPGAVFFDRLPNGPTCRRGGAPAAFFAENCMSKASKLAARAQAARQYLQTFRRLRKLSRAFICEHGHFGCAAEPNGACTDELVRLIGAADDSDARPRS
jgi:hypothetical protein